MVTEKPAFQVTGLHDQFTDSGIAIVEDALALVDLKTLSTLFPTLAPRMAGARAAGFSTELRTWLSTHEGLSALACDLLQVRVQLSRLQAIDKSATANWFVPWHQDRSEDGRERSVAKLQQTVALRIHLDDSNEDNGPLEVIPGSHTHGRLTADEIARLVAQTPSQLCLAARGDIVAVRPLLIHRSQRARIPAARRVIHLEYTALLS